MPSEDADRTFQAALEEKGVAEMLDSVESQTTVLLLSKLGSLAEQARKGTENLQNMVSKLSNRIASHAKTDRDKKNKAKLLALERLDPEKSQEKKQRKDKRRRMYWSQKAIKKKGNKRIQETFDAMSPVKVYKEKVSIEKRFGVVRWYNNFLQDFDQQKKQKEQEQEGQKRGDEDDENKLSPGSKKKQRKRERKRQDKAHGNGRIRRFGVNILNKAIAEFPGVVNRHTSLSRWADAAKKQRWEDIPEEVRKAHKEIPDDWKRSFGETNSKGQQRYQKVPAEVLTALDEHLMLVCRGLSDVTERNEEVMLREIAP